MTLRALHSYFGDVMRLSLEEFARAQGDAPWLLVQPYAEPSAETRVATVSGSTATPTQRSLGRVMKRAGSNAFAHMITLGRMPNNDIHLPAADVSGFHAYFLLQADGSLQLADASSSFGTTIDAEPLVPQRPVPVDFGQEIVFATVRARLLRVEEVYEQIKLRPRE